MKYIKRFENENGWQPTYNVGDRVICIHFEPYNTKRLEKYKIYEIQRASIEQGDIYYKFKGVDFSYGAKNFRLATPENIAKYELEQSVNNYNL